MKKRLQELTNALRDIQKEHTGVEIRRVPGTPYCLKCSRENKVLIQSPCETYTYIEAVLEENGWRDENVRTQSA